MRLIKIISICLFLTLFTFGFWLSQHKPLWNDEIFSQVENIEVYSYSDIFYAQMKDEGNKCPLFYVLQKAITQISGYKFPFKWEQEWLIEDAYSQFLLRIQPNFFMSLSIVLIFFYFSKQYSIATGCYAFLLSISSIMVWAYWLDARPYALWFFLTTAQSLLFLEAVQNDNEDCLTWLGLTHLALAFTVVIGGLQILICSFYVWLFTTKNSQRYFLLTWIPLIISFFYFYNTPKVLTTYMSLPHAIDLFFINFSLERFMVVGGYACVFAFWAWNHPYSKEGRGDSASYKYLSFLLSLLFATGVLFYMYETHSTAKSEAGFKIHERYFIYLAPIEIIATALFSREIFNEFRNNFWTRSNIIISLTGILFIQAIRTYYEIYALALYF